MIERPAGGGRPATLHFLSRPTVSHEISWDAVVRGEALYVEIPREPFPEGSKERWGSQRGWGVVEWLKVFFFFFIE